MNIDIKDYKTWPYELQEAIDKEHRAISENNACDHRATSQASLDDATSIMIRNYQKWLTLRAALSEEEVARCRKYWDKTRREKTWGLSSDLITVRLDYGWILCPRWAAVLDEVRKLREILI
jgi:hypothetical protein